MSGPIRVLHVDDDHDLTELVAVYLERADDSVTVETATTVSEGLQRVREGAVDCIVSDYDMPEMTGLEFFETVRDTHPDLPFILFTGKGSEEVASDAISAGVTDYLQKERGTDQYTILANRVRNAVERQRAERARERHLGAIETAHEGISILDENGRFIYVNDAYCDLYGYSSDELLGMHWPELYPPEDVPEMRDEVLPEVFETGYWRGETTGVRADGSTFVEDHTLATTEGGELVCTVRDASDRRERERAIDELHEVSQSLLTADTPEEVGELTVSAVRDILGIPTSGVHLYDEEAGTLPPVAWTEESEELAAEIPTFTEGSSLAWEVFETGEVRHLEDASRTDGRYNGNTAVRSEIILPLDGHGVLLVGSPETAAFDGTDVSLARTVASNAAMALTQLERERALEEERTFVTQALNSLDDVFFVVGTDGRLKRWNDRLVERTGYSPSDLENANVTTLFDDPSNVVDDAITDAIETGQTTVEGGLPTPDGERIPYEFRGRRLTDATDDPVGVVGIGRDVSERLDRERTLTALHDVGVDLAHHESVRQICERAIAASQDILEFDLSVIDIEEDGVLRKTAISENVDLANMKDMTVEEGIVGRVYRTGDPSLVHDAADHEDADPQGPYESAITVPIGDHGVFQAVSEAPGAFDETDLEFAQLLVSHVDSALDRLAYEQRLRQQNERLEEFASLVSHDLRNPLTVASGWLELAREEHDSDALARVATSLERSQTLIDDLLALARNGDRITSLSDTSLDGVVAACWDSVYTDDAELEGQTAAIIRADDGRLRQLLENLFRNSIEHGGADVTVTVGTLSNGFYVEDDGPGIPAVDRAEVFDAGFTTAESGNGLGLAIVEQIAAAHGWTVDVTESEAGGARFEFRGVEFVDAHADE